MRKLLALLGALGLPVLALAGDSVTTGDSLAPVPVSRVQNAGTNLPRHRTLNFTGSGITCADDAANQKTTCTASGGGGSVTSVTGTPPIASSGGTTPAISITAADGSNAGSLTAAAQTIGGVKTFSAQPVSANGYALSTATITESSGNVALVTTNSAAGPAWLIKSGANLNAGSSILRLNRFNDVLDFNFKQGGQLDTNGNLNIGGAAGAGTVGIFGNGTLTLTGNPADSSTAIGLKLNSSGVTYSTAGAKLLSVQNNTTERFNVDKDGQPQLGIGQASTKPTCDSTQRGKLWYSNSANGTTDTLFACLKAAADTFSWVSVATGG